MPKSTDAEKAARKAAIKAAKKENRELNKLNADISVCDFIIDEMNKYNTLRIQKQVERSRALEAAGYNGIFYYSKEDMAEAKALPKSTHEEREIRSDAITHARALKNARKAMVRFYGSPENIVELQTMRSSPQRLCRTTPSRISSRRREPSRSSSTRSRSTSEASSLFSTQDAS